MKEELAERDKTARSYLLFLLGLGFSEESALNKPFDSILVYAEIERERKQLENDAAKNDGGKQTEYKIRNRG